MKPPLEKAIIPFMGFTEKEGELSGTEDAFRLVLRKFASPSVTVYHPRSWAADVRKIAAQLVRFGVKEIVIISYSHGSAAAVALAKECAKNKISVSKWLSCDAVARPRLPRHNLFQIFTLPRVLAANAHIKVPANVMEVDGVRQRTQWPYGCDLKATGYTRHKCLKYLMAGHTQIDSHPDWWALVEKHLTEWTTP
jgi:hypothetical protein